ncbi:phage tail tape measure protein [Clostridium sp.]|uniref:phage tail tape measure protein n=1 Tax=Clostridium sp. TaxID=1506 RepID=UPI003216857A
MAANSSTVIARIGLDDRGFQDGVAKIQRGLKLVQSEFAVASSKLGDFGKSTEGLRLKADTLNKQIEIQKDKVSALNKSFQESVEKKGADAKATENLKIKLNYAVAELNKMENELKSTTKELKEKSSAWYKLSESMDKAGEKMKAVGDKMSSAGKKLTTAVTLPLVGIGTAVTKMAMDAEESENLFEVAMGSMAGDARKWSEETSKALGLNAFNVRKNVATYNSMLTSMGLTSEESLKMSEGLTQLSYDMASFYNLKPEEAFEKLKSGISGEAEPLKALGILVNDNTIKTYAYSNGIAKQGEQLTEAQKVQARYGAILDATKNAQGDLARTMDSPTNKIRAMKEQAQQIGIQFGQILIPILEKLIAVIKPLMDRFQGLSKEQQEQIVKIGLIVAAVGPIILIIGKVVTIIGTLFSVISTVSGAIAAAGGASAAFGVVLGALTGPVAIVIAIITGLIAVGVLLYKNWDAIKEFMVKMWEQVKVNTSNAVLAIKTVISSTFNAIRSVVLAVTNGISNIIKTSWNVIMTITSTVWNGIKNVIVGILNGIKGTVQGVINIISSIISGVWNGIKTVTVAVWGGIKTAITTPINLARDAVRNAVNAIVGFFKNIRLPEIRIPKIKLPHFRLNGEFNLKPPRVPSLSVEWYAKGGIFTRPSVIGVGEAGTEAVLPIDRLDDILAKALEKVKVKGNGNGDGLTLHIENFINNTDKDIEQLAYELEFYRQRVVMGKGGN